MANAVHGIGGLTPDLQVAPAATGVRSRAAAAQGPVAGAAPSADSTALTGLGNFIKSATAAARTRSSFRPDLVASLKAQIGAGVYHPDHNAVAARVAAALKA